MRLRRRGNALVVVGCLVAMVVGGCYGRPLRRGLFRRAVPAAHGIGGLPRRLGLGATTGYYNHPRFHPVPTQPVFMPRGDGYSVTGSGWHQHETPPLGERLPGGQRLDALPRPELVPTPPAGSEQSEKTGQPRPLEKISGAGSWVFRPSAVGDPESAEPVPRVGLKPNRTSR